MEQKIERYVQKLLSQKVENLKDENGSILIDLIKYIYNDADILMFTFPFLDKIDDFLIDPENLDLIEKLFRIIKNENSDFDIITSGNFGKWIYQLIEDGKIDFKGNVVVMNGKIRNMEGEKKNPVEIIKKKYDISNKKFIFVDDSYFSGETKNNIDDFLKKYNTSIHKTYVFYTHKTPPTDVYTLYCFEDKHKKDKMIHNSYKYFDFVKKLNLKDSINVIKKNIKLGEIRNSKELIEFIKKLNKIEEKLIIKYSKFING